MRNPIILAICLLPTLVHADEQVRTIPAYDSIAVHGPCDLVIEAGKAPSLTISGNKDNLDRITTEVVDGRLTISIKMESHKMEGKNAPHIHVTLAELRQLDEEGAGQTVLTNIDSKRLDINFKGAGRLAASGKVKDLHLNALGAGEVDTKSLIARDAQVEFKGVGSVKVYAEQHLDVSVAGMGELLYYGHPRELHKSVAGLGSLGAGD